MGTIDKDFVDKEQWSQLMALTVEHYIHISQFGNTLVDLNNSKLIPVRVKIQHPTKDQSQIVQTELM